VNRISPVIIHTTVHEMILAGGRRVWRGAGISQL